MRSAIAHLLLLTPAAFVAAEESTAATFLGVVDFRRPEEQPPVVVTSSVGGLLQAFDGDEPKLNPTPKSNAADGSKGTHYGDPAEGCMKDEHPFQIQGVDGMICAPKCTAFRPCPSDLPAGVTAAPQCALKSPDGNTYCALICSPELSDEDGDIDMDLDDDVMLRGAAGAAMTTGGGAVTGGGECGAATCQAIGGAGICTYSE